MVRISSLSLEYLRVPVKAAVDPINDLVEFAFTDGPEPGDADWANGGWEDTGPPYEARILVGPDGDVELDEGLWTTWLRISHDPERPVIMAGLVEIF